MTGFLRSIGFIGDEPALVPAAPVDPPVLASEDPQSSRTAVDAGRGRDAEPEHLRRKRERVQRAEVERDLAISDLILAEAHYARHRPTWGAE